VVTNATSYDVLVGSVILYPMGFVLDFWKEIFFIDMGGNHLSIQYFVHDVGHVGGVTMLVEFANTLSWGMELMEGNLDVYDLYMLQKLYACWRCGGHLMTHLIIHLTDELEICGLMANM
jgi:hypothetical protein